LLEYGDFIEQVRKTVDDKKIDLIVMGSRGASGLKRCILGSNTGNVLVKVSCNTLVVPKKAKFAGPGKIIFPTDCNIFYSHRILEGISDIILCCDAQLQILNILKRNGILSLVQEQNKLYLKDYLEELYADSFDFRNITGTKILTAIEHTAANGNIGMIMMVAKNLNILEKVFIDSTIQRLRFHSRVPLMVLHG
jgi:nucleotide-binding universal stress UspA family protein